MRRIGTAVVLALATVAAVACRPLVPVRLGAGNGYVDGRSWAERQDAYLRFSTGTLDRTSPSSVYAHLVRADRDRHFAFDATSITPADFQAVFDKIDANLDTSDFDMMRLMSIWSEFRGDIGPELRAAIQDRLTGFRYWFTDPLPAGTIDDKWFWSENHRLIVHTLEYLAGLTLPRETFEFTGEPGSVHRERGRARIEAWLDEKARFGFSEWHSDVYYAKDIEPLLLLTEFGEPAIARRAAAMLDLFFYDIAVHQIHGNFGVTHGRSYMKDKSRATDQDTFTVTKLAFDTTSLPYESRANAAATALAAAKRYRVPEVIRRIARTDRTFVDRQHMGVDIGLDQPLTANPVAPEGAPAFDDPDGIAFWWERGSVTAWPSVPLSLQTIEEHGLWDTSLFAPYKPMADLAGGNPDTARSLAYALRCQINLGLLGAVDSVTWRSADAMLSSAQDQRPGCFGHQYHAWQATLDEDAIVFTTSPGNEPRPIQRWVDADLYWNGGPMPRSAQQGSAVINLYAPQYVAGTGPLSAFAYLDYTHAYFPTERFDEVRQVDGWTFGRRGDGYVALWSWRPTEWRTHDPAVTFTNGLTQPFDLVAPGGPDNVWITEVGDAGRNGSFDDFVASMSAAPISVTDLGEVGGVSQGFDVAYTSPTEGEMAFSWTGPLTVDGTEVPLHRTARIDNPFTHAEEGATKITIDDGTARLDLDLATGRRVAVARPR
ncbi:MAG: hypothetical protein KF906_07830 [Actinobacteria bacterium]|nr:hypothetical protein [Actinomycetota bacterium]